MNTRLLSDDEITKVMDQDVLELIGGGSLSPEKKQELYKTIAETVQNRAIARVYSELTEEEGSELDKLLDAGDANKVQEYLRGKDLELPAILTQEAIAYKLEVYELFKLAKKMPAKE